MKKHLPKIVGAALFLTTMLIPVALFPCQKQGVFPGATPQDLYCPGFLFNEFTSASLTGSVTVNMLPYLLTNILVALVIGALGWWGIKHLQKRNS
jgi:hypothetical protein